MNAAAIILDGYRQVHQRMRAELETLDPALLHLTPAPETSSIAALVRHTLGSEGDVLHAVAGLPSARDRAAEFRATADIDLASLVSAQNFRGQAAAASAQGSTSPSTQ
jgi:DinB family protein